MPNAWRSRACPLTGVILPLFLALSAVPGCAKDEAPSADTNQPASVPAQPAAAGEANKVPTASRALRITTDTTVASADVAATVQALRTAVVEAGGYVSDLRTSGTEAQSKTADLEARIPVDKLGSFRAKLSGYGEVLADNEKAEDVTEQRTDLKARLRNARAQEKRLLDLLSDRTGSLADVIAAEKALAEVREQVERLEAQEQLLEGQISHATVKIRIVANREIASPSASGRVRHAASQGITYLGKAAVGLVVIALTLGPTALLMLAIGATMYFVIRKLQKKFGRPRATPPAWREATVVGEPARATAQPGQAPSEAMEPAAVSPVARTSP